MLNERYIKWYILVKQAFCLVTCVVTGSSMAACLIFPEGKAGRLSKGKSKKIK